MSAPVFYFKKGEDLSKRVPPIPGKDSRLMVLRPVGTDLFGNLIWECLCSCGIFCEVSTSHVNANYTKSCGCLRRDRSPNLHFSNPRNPYSNRLGKIRYRHEFLYGVDPGLMKRGSTLDPSWDEDPDLRISLRRGIQDTIQWRGWPEGIMKTKGYEDLAKEVIDLEEEGITTMKNHLCEDLCLCIKCSSPLLYDPEKDLHSCRIPSCACAEGIPTGGRIYRNKKTGTAYVVVGFAKDSVTANPRVLYKSTIALSSSDPTDLPWDRPIEEWFDKFEAEEDLR